MEDSKTTTELQTEPPKPDTETTELPVEDIENPVD